MSGKGTAKKSPYMSVPAFRGVWIPKFKIYQIIWGNCAAVQKFL